MDLERRTEVMAFLDELGIPYEIYEHPPVPTVEEALPYWESIDASPKRMERYLGVGGGSVSAFGIINDHEHHVHLFIDARLRNAERISFHPNENSATFVISFASFIKFLESCGNSYEFIALYED